MPAGSMPRKSLTTGQIIAISAAGVVFLAGVVVGSIFLLSGLSGGNDGGYAQDSPGQSANYAETVLNIGTGSVFSQSVQLSFDEVEVDILSEVAEFTLRVNYKDNPWGSGLASNQFYFNTATTESKNTFGEYEFTVAPSVWEDPYPYTFTVFPLDGTTCGSQINGSDITIFSDSANILTVGSAASLAADTMSTVTAGGYSYELNGTYYVLSVTLSGGNTSITTVTDCGNTPPAQQ
jgi:hypothetical protein